MKRIDYQSLEKEIAAALQKVIIKQIRKAGSQMEPVEKEALVKLQKHLLWFASKKITEIYKTLGTSPEELDTLSKLTVLSEKDKARIAELAQKAADLKESALIKLGATDDTARIEKERKKAARKRLNDKDHWLPLR